ncbi:hypothetical protein [Brevibacillus laterosporus]|uniref:hypothetical protein n=1 Tax=Brevibacillus laterosporus TaxID=1465 RepID=UPI002404C91A|nr:hypothetical protein [Brevibacillus laterosporus]
MNNMLAGRRGPITVPPALEAWVITELVISFRYFVLHRGGEACNKPPRQPQGQ